MGGVTTRRHCRSRLSPIDLRRPVPLPNYPTPDDSPDDPVLSPSDVDRLHIVAADLGEFPDRNNVMAVRVAEDLSRLAAADAGPDELRAAMTHWSFDDVLVTLPLFEYA
jgi:hypothetical protein